MEKKETLQEKASALFLCLVCVITNISQLPQLTDVGLSSTICIPVWLLLFVMAIVFSKQLVLSRDTINLFLIYILLTVILLFHTIVTKNSYFSSSSYYSLCIAMFVYFIGTLLAKQIHKEGFIRFYKSYVVSACIVAVVVYIQYFKGKETLTTKIYAYDSKNSLSQILLSAVILAVCSIPNNKMSKIIKIGVSLFLGALILLMRSRATIIGIPIMIFYLTTNKKVKRRDRIAINILCCAAVLAILFNQILYDTVVNNILFANRSITDLDDLSSGRISLIKKAFRMLQDNYLFGIGAYYLDCYPVASVLQFGIIPGVIFCVIALIPFYKSIKFLKSDGIMEPGENIAFLIISSIYAVNGLFEGLTPLGPGVKCYLLWFLLGIYSEKQNMINRAKLEHNE